MSGSSFQLYPWTYAIMRTRVWRKGAQTVFTRVSLVVLILALILASTGCFFGSTDVHQTAFVTAPLNAGIAVYKISNLTGKFSQVLGSPYPTGISPTQVVVHPSGKYAYLANGGENDISLFKIASSGALTEVMPRTPAGTKPSALAISSSGNLLFVANADSNTINSYSIDAASGSLKAGSSAQTGFTPLKLALSPSAQFLYASNNSSNTISGFAVDSSGNMTPVPGSPNAVGAGPNGITIDPSGKFLYVASLIGGNFSGFSIDSGSGALAPLTGSPYAVAVSTTVIPLSAVATDLKGNFLYVSALNANKLYAYTINSSNGVPAAIPNSPFATGGGPAFISTDADGQFLFVGNQSTSNVTVFRITSSSGTLTTIATETVLSAPTSMAVIK
jgi:6-phosphogluconolactonase (cycloisomerase 2 family)